MFEALLLVGSLWTAPAPPAAEGAPPCCAAYDVGFDIWQRPDVWSIPIHEARPGDPLRVLWHHPDAWRLVAAGRWRRSGNPPDIEAEILEGARPAFPPGNVFSSTSATTWILPQAVRGRPTPAASTVRFRAGEGMDPAPGLDGHLVVRQPDGRILEAYGAIRLSQGDFVALSYAMTDPRGAGDGDQNGQTASMLPAYLGVLDDAEATRLGIGHAVAITVPPALLAPCAVPPARAFDRDALTHDPPYAGYLPMGSRLVLPPSMPVEALPLATSAGRALAMAARNHGFIIVDRGGEGISLRVRRRTGSASRPFDWSAPLAKDVRMLFGRLVPAVGQGCGSTLRRTAAAGAGLRRRRRAAARPATWPAAPAPAPARATSVASSRERTRPMLSKPLLRGAAAVLAAVLAACSTPPPIVDAPEEEYRLDAGDRIQVDVYGQKELSGSFTLDAAGRISLLRAGVIPLRGHSFREAERLIAEGLRSELKHPEVSVNALEYRPVFVTGQVHAPGKFPYASGLTVLQAVALANGIAPRGDRRKIVLIRGGRPPASVADGTLLKPGDTVEVLESLF